MTGILQALLASVKAAVSAVTDEYFEYVSLLLPGNGTNGAQNNTFLDSSTNNFTITRNGNTTQGTFSPYGDNWSNYFDGNASTSLTASSTTAFDFGTGDFTIECWVYVQSQLNSFTIICATESVNQYWGFGSLGSGGMTMYAGTSGTDIYSGSGNTPSLNQWNHLVWQRSSGVASMYLNGTRVYNAAYTADFGSTAGGFRIGQSFNYADYYTIGYISNLRVVKGSGVYSGATITVPTAPLTAITNTSLLTCQSNRFIDNSTNAFAITRNGNTSVQRFSPFSPTAAYSASTIGGSGYFDGSGDYLSIANTSSLNLGSSNYTMEIWVYPTSFATSFELFTYYWYNSGESGDRQIALLSNTSGVITAYFNDSGYAITSSIALKLNSWNHVALVRNGSTFTLYINGASGGTGTWTGTYTSVTWPIWVGAGYTKSGNTDFYYTTGYLSDFRVVIGTAVYTAAFTPTTAPLTAITNTKILCNMTNAGIIDNAMMNDLETVGNAQISTTQSKFGGSSMYFDGTGDYLVTPSSPSNILGSGDFTVEFWMYPSNTSSAYKALVASENYNSTTGGWTIYQNGTSIEIWLSPGTPSSLITATSAITASTWQHVALSRASGTVRLFVNGTSVGSASNSAEWTGQRIFIGDNNVTGTDYFYNGYIDELRITKGVARYAANFTAPTSAFPTS